MKDVPDGSVAPTENNRSAEESDPPNEPQSALKLVLDGPEDVMKPHPQFDTAIKDSSVRLVWKTATTFALERNGQLLTEPSITLKEALTQKPMKEPPKRKRNRKSRAKPKQPKVTDGTVEGTVDVIKRNATMPVYPYPMPVQEESVWTSMSTSRYSRICPKCGLSFDTGAELSEHMNTHMVS